MVAAVNSVVDFFKLQLHIFKFAENSQRFIKHRLSMVDFAKYAFNKSHAAASRNVDSALVGSMFAFQQAKQRGFTAAVYAYKSYFIIVVNIKADIRK